MRGTIDLVLTLGAYDITKIKLCFNVSYGIHSDCKSHTGGAIYWVWSVLLSKFQKQKLNTKSPTEAKIIGVIYYVPNVIWARMFLGTEGFVIEENILFQHNQSENKIEDYGKTSSG